MARFVDDAGTKFWEIERDGATIVRRSGKVGAQGRTQARTFANPLVARHHHAGFVAAKLREGFHRLDAPRAEADPFPPDDEGRLVHADALQQQGDPLGQLIVLQHARAQADDFQAGERLQREIDDVIDANADTWFGDLWKARDLFVCDWHLGRLGRVKLGPHGEDKVRWRKHLHELLADVPPELQLATLVEALWDLPIARALEILELPELATADVPDLVRRIAGGAPATLRRLWLNHKAPRRYAEADLVPLQLPALAELDLNLRLSPRAVAALAGSTLPALTTLAFGLAEETTRELAPVFAGACFPALRRLEIWCLEPRALVDALLVTPPASRLAEVVIRGDRPVHPEVLAALRARAPNVAVER